MIVLLCTFILIKKMRAHAKDEAKDLYMYIYFEVRYLKRLLLKIGKDLAFLMCFGSEFHNWAPEKDRLCLQMSRRAAGSLNSSPLRELAEESIENFFLK